MEEDLDRIEASETDATGVLTRFYAPFKNELEQAADNMLSVKGVGIETALDCPECGRKLHIKVGKNGHFLACSGYPECTYSRDYTRDERGHVHAVEIAEDEVSDKICRECGEPMVIKQGKYGKFLACSAYPKCTHTESVNGGTNGRDIGIKCPQQDCEGHLVEKTSKRGKIFYGCNRYPDCTFATWDKPVDKSCPKCQGPFLVEKTTKKNGTSHVCPVPGCGYKEQIS